MIGIFGGAARRGSESVAMASPDLEAGRGASGWLDAPVVGAAPRRRWPAVMCLALLVGMLTGVGWLMATARVAESDLTLVRRLMDADRFAEARERLIHLPPGRSNDPEVAYRLGVCEHARGDIPAALAAWSRVDPRSAWAAQAGLARPAPWWATSAGSAKARRSSRRCCSGTVRSATRCDTPSRS